MERREMWKIQVHRKENKTRKIKIRGSKKVKKKKGNGRGGKEGKMKANFLMIHTKTVRTMPVVTGNKILLMIFQSKTE